MIDWVQLDGAVLNINPSKAQLLGLYRYSIQLDDGKDQSEYWLSIWVLQDDPEDEGNDPSDDDELVDETQDQSEQESGSDELAKEESENVSVNEGAHDSVNKTAQFNQTESDFDIIAYLAAI